MKRRLGEGNQNQRQRTKKNEDSDYIDPKYTATLGERRRTRSMAAPDRKEQQKKETEAQKEAERQAQEDYEEEIRNRPKALPGNRKDGQFHIAFIDVGLGDCTILTTPDGVTMLIDCGSDSQNKDDKDKYVQDRKSFLKTIQDTIYGPKFLGFNKKLDILALTHSDTDHWNLLKSVLKKETTIGKCYHSGDLGVYGQTRSQVMDDHKCKLFQSVTLNEEGYALMNNEPLPTETSKKKIDVISKVRCDIKIVDEDNCKISIIASNVYKEGSKGVHDFLDLQLTSGSTPPNRGSLVILVEVFDKKILICGDATLATEEFMHLNYAPWIQNIDVLRVAHHGSETSSGQSFSEWVEPKKCIISAGRRVFLHALPKYKIVQRWLNVLPQLDTTAPTHFIGGWKGPGNNTFKIIDTSQELYITGMNGTQEITYPNPSRATTTTIVTSKSKK